MYKILKILKKVCKVWVFESKNPVLGSKSSEKVRKKFGKFRKSSETGFSKCLEILEILEIIFSKISENYEKMTLNSNFGNCEKRVLTWKPSQKFG